MKAKICGSLCLLSAAVLLSNAHAETPSDVLQAIPHTEELLNVVVVSRHGVRSPTQSAEKLHGWSDKKWPAWPLLLDCSHLAVFILSKPRGNSIAVALLLPTGSVRSRKTFKSLQTLMNEHAKQPRL